MKPISTVSHRSTSHRPPCPKPVSTASAVDTFVRSEVPAVSPIEPFRRRDFRAAARGLVASLPVGPPVDNDISQMRVLMRVPFGALESIEHYGLLNIHQLAASHGSFAPEARLEREKSIFGGAPPADVPKSLLPKSGFLSFSSKTMHKVTEASEQYGDILLSFRPDIKDRTTYTVGDSLLPGKHYTPLADLSVLATDGAQVKDPYVSYFEAQIWGDLDLGDVEEIWYPQNTPPERVQDLRHLAQRHGLKLCSYDLDIPAYSPKVQEAYDYHAQLAHNLAEFGYHEIHYLETDRAGRSSAERPTLREDFSRRAPQPTLLTTEKQLVERLGRATTVSELFVLYERLDDLGSSSAAVALQKLQAGVSAMTEQDWEERMSSNSPKYLARLIEDSPRQRRQAAQSDIGRS